ncbi:MAG: lactate utilization protein [Deltaproteobacteria bacterium]|nr:lactate utilization protein [Deltaproteobacteria bacterium]OQX64246.1 MAG: lactate utilization protein C [Desulfococcus sp. 4484_242]
MENSYQTWLWEKRGEACVRNLRKHGFDACLVHSRDEARELVLGMISGYETFGFGGSDTIRCLGLVEAFKAAGKTVYDHWQDGLTKQEDLEIRLQQGRCDCFLCSANAIAVTGEIINVDGIGNRTNAMTFGPKKVFIIAGMNKVTADLESGLKRIREVAGPMRARSLGMETPCAGTGICTDCNAPQRICRATLILHRRPLLTDISVILINESLGF